MVNNKVEFKETVLGTHCWTNCPYEEVAFLKNEHHHDFTFTVSCDVEHNDRDLEFIMLRVALKKFMKGYYKIDNEIFRFGSRSCEMLSDEVCSFFEEEYGVRNWKVSVSEDGTYKGGKW